MSKGIPNKTIKNTFIFLISFLTISFLIINSTQFKGLKQKIKTDLFPRSLQETAEKSTKICDKISPKLKTYFRTGDKSELGLEEDHTEEYGEYYIEALINMVKNYYEKKEKKQGTNTRILDGDDSSTGYMKYLLKYAYHILPLLIVFGIGILSLLGWIICCCCTCCKCKCCVCKVPKCKTPSTVLAIIFYIIVALISFYALTEQSKIFSGLADIECSVLKFTDEVLYGENIKYPPYWAGIDKIAEILGSIKQETNLLDQQTVVDTLNTRKGISDGKKGVFETELSTQSNNIYDNYKVDSGKYQLDIANQFGSSTSTSENSVYKLWLNEYQTIALNANGYMENVGAKFQNIFDLNSVDNFETGINKINELKTDFLSLKKLIADQIMEKADDIDKIGKLVYTLFFTFLMILCAAIVVFMLLLCCCSGELCTNLSCCQCFCKFFLHFFWNLMAFIMFILFMGGSMFTISGTTGGDLVKVVSYLISEDNLGADKDTIILGKVKQYLNQCFNYDGKILTELGLDERDFEELKKAQLNLEEYRNQFADVLYKFVYSEYQQELNQRIKYNTPDLKLVEIDSETDPDIKFNDLLEIINNYANSHNIQENWSITSNSDDTCASGDADLTHSDPILYHPYKCYPTYKNWITGISDNTQVENAIQKLIDIKNLIDIANSDSDTNSIKTIINELSNTYHTFLTEEIKTLDLYIEKIKKITNHAKDYTSDDGELFSFMNCAFIKDNVNVILFYLKNSFENDMYEVGVYLLIAAFAMPFGISFTILLIMISNDEIEANKKKEEDLKNRKSQVGFNPIQEVKVENNIDNGNSTEQRRLNQNNP